MYTKGAVVRYQIDSGHLYFDGIVGNQTAASLGISLGTSKSTNDVGSNSGYPVSPYPVNTNNNNNWYAALNGYPQGQGKSNSGGSNISIPLTLASVGGGNSYINIDTTGISNWLNDTTPPLAQYGVPTIPSSGDVANIVLSTVAGTVSGTIAGNADKVNKPLTAFENGNGFYQKAPDGSIETFTPKINKTVAKIGNIAGKSIAGVTLALDVENTWTANSGNTNLQRLAKTGIQGLSTAASVGVGYVSGTVAAAGIATSEVGVGVFML